MNRRRLVTVASRSLVLILALTCDEPRAVTSPQINLSDHGITRSVPHHRPECRNCVGSKRGAPTHSSEARILVLGSKAPPI